MAISMTANRTAKPAHSLIEKQVRQCLAAAGGAQDWAETVRSLAADPEKLIRLLEVVANTYAENDLYLERILAALDRSSDEVRALHREEAAKSSRLEALLAERDREAESSSFGPVLGVNENFVNLKAALKDMMRFLDGGSGAPVAAVPAGQAPAKTGP